MRCARRPRPHSEFARLCASETPRRSVCQAALGSAQSLGTGSLPGGRWRGVEKRCPRSPRAAAGLTRVGAAAGAEPAGRGARAEAAPPGAHLVPRGQDQARLPAPPQLLQARAQLPGVCVAGKGG